MFHRQCDRASGGTQIPAKILLIATSFAVGGMRSLAAQESLSIPGDENLQEVIVTAQKRAQNLQDVPLAVSTLYGEALAERHVTNLLELQTIVPNVSLQQRLASGVV